MTGASPSVGSSRRRRRGARVSARAMAEHLLLAAGKQDAAMAAARGEPRERPVDSLEGPAVRDAREGELFLDRQGGEDSAFLGHECDAHPRDAMGRKARDVDAAEAHLAGLCRHDADDGFQGRGLAGAVASEQRDGRAGFHAERERLEHMAPVVTGVDTIERQHDPAAGSVPGERFVASPRPFPSRLQGVSPMRPPPQRGLRAPRSVPCAALMAYPDSGS